MHAVVKLARTFVAAGMFKLLPMLAYVTPMLRLCFADVAYFVGFAYFATHFITTAELELVRP
jgi:hypothetical protein